MDREGVWSNLTQKKTKRSPPDKSQESRRTVTAREALVMMVNDCDHGMRMHVAKAITSLYTTSTKEKTSAGRSGNLSAPHSTMTLLSCTAQEETFKQVFEKLQLVNVVSDGLDELSSEDDSVNRVASRIYSLLMQGCVSPTCERMVVKELLQAVGEGCIDTDLVAKVSLSVMYVYYEFHDGCR